MSSLVPVRRTDKNGRAQTRWVKDERPSPGRRAAIPAPAAPALLRPGSKRDAAAEELGGMLRLEPQRVLFEAFADALSRVSAKATPAYKLRAVIDGLGPETAERIESSSQPTHFALRCLFERSLTEGTAAHLNNLAICADGLGNLERWQQNCIHEVIAGLQAWGFAGQPPTDWSKLRQDEADGARAVVWSVFRLDLRSYLGSGEIGDGHGVWIKHPGLHELIMRRPADAERIAHLINERALPVGTDEDIAVVETLLDQGGATAVGSGVL